MSTSFEQPITSCPPSRSDSFEDGPRSPSNEFDSEAALILVSDHEQTDDMDSASFGFSSDEERDEEDSFQQAPSSTAPLSSISVFLYLISPLLKLGALLSTFEVARLPLKLALPGLFFFACLCAFSRQIWYMLSRYVRRTDIEEIFLESFARGRGKEQRRYNIRMTVRFSIALLRVLLVAMYLQSCADVLVRYLPERLFVPQRFVATTVLALLITPLCFAPSLSSNLVLYPTWLSVATYVAWFACTVYAHAKGMFFSPKELHPPALWQGLSIIAFTYTTSHTIPLYAALRGTYQPGLPKPKRSQTFKILSLLSIVIATALIVPTILFNSQASPFALQTTQETPKALVDAMSFLSLATLLLGIPSIFAMSPTLPVPLAIRRRTSLPVSKMALFVITYLMSYLYDGWARAMCDVLLVLAFLGTFTVPALVHIVLHNFRRPLSIVMPTTPAAPSHPSLNHSDSYNDELLQRKERTLQRRRFARRILWDIGVWTLLIPVSGGGLVWVGGRLLGKW